MKIDRNIIEDTTDIKNFLFAGKSTFTIENVESGNRFTYKVTKPEFAKKEEKDIYFISLLTGRDNVNNYTFIGSIYNKGVYKHSSKSSISEKSQGVNVFNWYINRLNTNTIPECVKFWHEGRCGKCGKKLTVPESIKNGLGPICASNSIY